MLLVLLENSKLETVQLSKYSHDRFQTTDEYEQIEHTYFIYIFGLYCNQLLCLKTPLFLHISEYDSIG